MTARLLLFVALTALAATGCGGTAAKHPTVKVSGTVTIDNTPVEKGVINFLSEGKVGDDSTDIVGGKFTATKVPQGKVRIFIVATKETGKMVPGSSTDVPEVISIVPSHYAQGLEANFAANEADYKIDLKSTP